MIGARGIYHGPLLFPVCHKYGKASGIARGFTVLFKLSAGM